MLNLKRLFQKKEKLIDKIFYMAYFKYIVFEIPVAGDFMRRIRVAFRVLVKGKTKVYFRPDFLTKRALKEILDENSNSCQSGTSGSPLKGHCGVGERGEK